MYVCKPNFVLFSFHLTEGGSKKRKMRAKVTFSYSPQNEDELELVVNETVEVVDQPEEGWWEGVIKGKHGLFPSNFVTMVDEDDASEAKSEGEYQLFSWVVFHETVISTSSLTSQ